MEELKINVGPGYNSESSQGDTYADTFEFSDYDLHQSLSDTVSVDEPAERPTFKSKMASWAARSNEDHHIGSALEALNIDMVEDFPVDPMHTIYQGVVKKRFLLYVLQTMSLNNPIKYHIVCGENEENWIELIPSKGVEDEHRCFWLPDERIKSERFYKLLNKRVEPNVVTWQLIDIKILKSFCYHGKSQLRRSKSSKKRNRFESGSSDGSDSSNDSNSDSEIQIHLAPVVPNTKGHENISKSRGEFNMSHVSCLETKGKRSVIRPTERNAHRENDDFEQTQDSMSFGFDAEEGEHEQDSNEGNYRISSIRSSPQLNHQVPFTFQTNYCSNLRLQGLALWEEKHEM
ncbi:hypothetical protein OUZ56_016926 [Daphnia magna]|uniref:Uncharacterized protein n=1 Tax=Daphnia magna TaxID=35525 RepID=A0ABR0ARS5_9CRUS|nr:hypothetical protein OUZ56_016926 [Daphnia magna]